MKRSMTLLLLLAVTVAACGVSYAVCRSLTAGRGTGYYHVPDCVFVKGLKTGDQICYDTQVEAKKAGYAPCPACKPIGYVKLYGSTLSRKYHLRECVNARNIPLEYLKEYDTPEEAAKDGKIACGACKPPEPVLPK